MSNDDDNLIPFPIPYCRPEDAVDDPRQLVRLDIIVPLDVAKEIMAILTAHSTTPDERS